MGPTIGGPSGRSLVRRREILRVGMASVAAVAVAPNWARASTGRVRVLNLYETHSHETYAEAYWVDGAYDPGAMARLNHLLRDWRSGELAAIDRRLIDLLHDLQQAGGGEPLHIISGYRSPETNAERAAVNGGVARNSYHVKGQAVDLRVPGRSLTGLRDMAVALAAGGVGFYPRSDFIHVDTGPVRTWS